MNPEPRNRYKYDKPQLRLSAEQKARLLNMLDAKSNVVFVDFIKGK